MNQPLPSSAPSQAPLSPTTQLWITALVGLSYFVLYADFSVISIATPSIGLAFGASASLLSWAIVGNSLAIAGSLIVGGKLIDRFGQRTVISIGLAGYGAGASIAALAPNIEVLIFARILQGVMTAGASPATFSLISTYIDDGAPRRRALAVFGISQGLSVIAGLLLGGAIVTSLGWRWLFASLVPLSLTGVVIAWIHLPSRPAIHREPIDFAGAAFLNLTLLLGICGLTRIPAEGLTVTTGALLLVAACSTAGFWLVERTAAFPLVPRSVFRSPDFGRFTIILAGFMGCFTGALLLDQILIQRVIGLSAAASGLAMMPFAATFVLVSLAFPVIAERLNSRALVLISGLTVVAGLCILGATARGGSLMLTVVPGTMLCAAGGLVFSLFILQAAARTLAVEAQGVGTAVMFTGMQIGNSLGASGALLLSSAALASARSSSLALPFASLALVVALSVLGAFSIFKMQSRSGQSVCVNS